MQWNIYLSGEIHTDWRNALIDGARQRDLPITFTSAVTEHQASDGAGDPLPPSGSEGFWRDHKSSRINAIRTQTLIDQCNLAVVRFGPQYKQWNAAFDAGYLAAKGKPYITLHDDSLIHPLKEVDAAAMAWATTVEQILDTLEYLIKQS